MLVLIAYQPPNSVNLFIRLSKVRFLPVISSL